MIHDDDAAMAAMGLPTGFRDKAAEDEEVLPDALHTIAVTQEQAGAKLAKHVATVVAGWSRNGVAAAAREGHVRVNGERSGANQVLESGDTVTVHAAPPAAPPAASGERAGAPAGAAAKAVAKETLTACQINCLVDERVRAKASADYALADKLFAELAGASVRVDDRSKTWSTPSGLSGMQTVLSHEELESLRPERTQQAAATAKPQDPAALAALEAERRRLKNAKKRECKARKLAAAETENPGEPLPAETSSEGGADGRPAEDEMAGTKRKAEGDPAS